MTIQRNISSEVGSLSCKSSLKSNKWCWTLKIIWMPIIWSQVKWSPFCGCWCQKWQNEKQIAETSERKGGRVLPPEAGDWADRVRERAYHCLVQTGRARRTDRHALLKPAHIYQVGQFWGLNQKQDMMWCVFVCPRFNTLSAVLDVSPVLLQLFLERQVNLQEDMGGQWSLTPPPV